MREFTLVFSLGLVVLFPLLGAGDPAPETPPSHPADRPYFTLAELAQAQKAAHQLHLPLAFIDGNLAALSEKDLQQNTEDELTQMAVAHLQDHAVIVFADDTIPMGNLPAVVRDQELFQMDDGPMEGGHHFYVPKIGFTDADVTTALGRVSETQLLHTREQAIDDALASIAADPKAQALLKAAAPAH